jgi:hypothetical protein
MGLMKNYITARAKKMVRRMKEDINDLGPINIAERSNLEQFDRAIPILRQGCERLYDLKVSSSLEIHTDSYSFIF